MLAREMWPYRRVWRRWCSWTVAIAAAFVAAGLLPGHSWAQQQTILEKDLGWKKPAALQGLEITGFGQNVTGIFENSEAFKSAMFGKAGNGKPNGNTTANSLASQRDWLQVDTNYDAPEGTLFGQNIASHFFMRNWFVYEPKYDIDQSVVENRKASDPTNTGIGFTKRSDDDFHNQFGFHEVWGSTRIGNHFQLFVGKQIVTWGESVAFRVADVLNPQDVSFGFGFANLEQSRLGRYMIRPIVDLPDVGPLNSSFLEVAYMPGFDLAYTQTDYIDGRFDGQDARAGRVSALPFPGERFAGIPERRNATKLGRFRWVQRPGVAFNPTVFRIPAATFANSDVGIRLHTVLYDTEMTLLYFYGHCDLGCAGFLTPHIEPAPIPPGQPAVPPSVNRATARHAVFRYDRRNAFGATFNRPVYLPGAFLNGVPIVLRGEMLYDNHLPFNTTDPKVLTGVKYSDVVTEMFALDLSNLFVGSISKTGPVNARVEWFNRTIMSLNKFMTEGGCAGGCLTRLKKNDSNILAQIGSSWWNNDIGFTWTSIYNPDGNTMRMFPDLLLTPPWTNKYFLDTRWIGIQGSDRNAGEAGGRFKGHDQFIWTFQYNFDLL